MLLLSVFCFERMAVRKVRRMRVCTFMQHTGNYICATLLLLAADCKFDKADASARNGMKSNKRFEVELGRFGVIQEILLLIFIKKLNAQNIE